MKKLLLVLCCVFFTGNASPLADDFDKEQVILKGLSKESRKERLKFLEMAKHTDSQAIFEKLARMYKVDDSVEQDVFFAMQAMNINNDGKFSSEFAEAVKEEYFRLKAFGWNPPDFCYPANIYLSVRLSTFQRRPYPGYDDFVDYVMQNIDDVLPSDIHPDAKTDILAECTL